jgi:hypothetical protein
MIPGWRARPIKEGKTERGASSPAKPAVTLKFQRKRKMEYKKRKTKK